MDPLPAARFPYQVLRFVAPQVASRAAERLGLDPQCPLQLARVARVVERCPYGIADRLVGRVLALAGSERNEDA
jgi:hypothetical protein